MVGEITQIVYFARKTRLVAMDFDEEQYNFLILQ